MCINWGGMVEIALGVYMGLIAFGVIPASKNPEKNKEWVDKYGKFLKIISPCLIIFGIITLLGLLK